MPISNGDSLGRAMHAEIQDYTKALEVLEKDYTTRDGLDVDTLLDSDKHGALTYNDFLILPGYIGKPSMSTSFVVAFHSSRGTQASLPPKSPWKLL